MDGGHFIAPLPWAGDRNLGQAGLIQGRVGCWKYTIFVAGAMCPNITNKDSHKDVQEAMWVYFQATQENKDSRMFYNPTSKLLLNFKVLRYRQYTWLCELYISTVQFDLQLAHISEYCILYNKISTIKLCTMTITSSAPIKLAVNYHIPSE